MPNREEKVPGRAASHEIVASRWEPYLQPGVWSDFLADLKMQFGASFNIDEFRNNLVRKGKSLGLVLVDYTISYRKEGGLWLTGDANMQIFWEFVPEIAAKL